MAAQRRLSKEAGTGKVGSSDDLALEYRTLLETRGPSSFVGYSDDEATAEVLAVLDAGGGHVEVVLDRTPFYAEGGGQVGDTGTIETDTGRSRVVDTTYALPGLARHVTVVEGGEIKVGQTATAVIDGRRRAAIRRNHTGTHLLHWALRKVLGSHVKQQGSLVAPDRLRFDFTHYGAVTAAEIRQIEDLVNDQVLEDADVHITEMSKADADASGAIAFFDEKYGETVRVIDAGPLSRELCGGTHVLRLGQIGPVEIVSEGSIGSNLRRIEATTGTATLARMRHREELLGQVAGLLKARPDDLAGAIERKLADLRSAEDHLRSARQTTLAGEAQRVAATAIGGVVVARHDGLPADQLRELATQVRRIDGVGTVVLGGSPDGAKVALVAMVDPQADVGAPEIVAGAAKTVGGGGGGKNHEVAQAGGRDPSRLDEALAQVRSLLGVGG